MAQYLPARLLKVVRNPHFWAVAAMFAIVTVFHYSQQTLGTDLPFPGLSRHAVERVFLLAPVAYASFFLGTRAGIASLAVVCAIMLPRAIFISPHPDDALLESAGVVAIGAVVNFLFYVFRKERNRYQQALSALETANQEVRESQESYKGLFEGAYDAILGL